MIDLSYEKAKESATKHNLLYQYTTYAALEKILRNKSGGEI